MKQISSSKIALSNLQCIYLGFICVAYQVDLNTNIKLRKFRTLK